MAGGIDRAHVRLAELVAALSLGVDLGFGQPMEHVLRQCLIALRLAERIGLDEQQRAVVYYAALLVSVGCHTDAHEQAKWFGDDISVKAIKCEHEPGMRVAAAAMRRLGSGSPPLHRFRVGLEFALSGHREVDDMFAHHAAVARMLGEQLGLPGEVLAALGAAYEQWDGRGWPDGLKGEEVPVASRLATLAEFVEVAHRLGGVDAAKRLARKRAGKQFDPMLAEVMRAEGEMILSGLELVTTWDAVSAAGRQRRATTQKTSLPPFENRSLTRPLLRSAVERATSTRGRSDREAVATASSNRSSQTDRPRVAAAAQEVQRDRVARGRKRRSAGRWTAGRAGRLSGTFVVDLGGAPRVSAPLGPSGLAEPSITAKDGWSRWVVACRAWGVGMGSIPDVRMASVPEHAASLIY